EHLEKVHRTTVMSLFPEGLEQERETHSIVGVGDRKPLRCPEEVSGRRKERLAEDHRSDRYGPQEPLPVVERLGAPANRAGEEALVVVGRLPVPVQPLDKVVERDTDRWQRGGGTPHGSRHATKLSSTWQTRSARRVFNSFPRRLCDASPSAIRSIWR